MKELVDLGVVVCNEKKYLSPDYDVHHKDMNKQNNDPNNLLILTTSEHIKLHHKIRKE